jgi:ribulose 1,5-bisphosphate carboxylase large subunit-like protein
MSSAGFSVRHDPAFYHWSPALNADDYMRACYEITATCDGMAAALAMALAMEQSVGATRIHAYIPDQGTLAANCIRVCRVRPLAETDGGVVAPYRLHTPVYDQPHQAAGSFAIELAVPLSLLANKPGQLGNILVGELPRLGFLTRFRLVGATLPTTFGPGPGFGAAGIRALAGQAVGPPVHGSDTTLWLPSRKTT